MASPESTIVQRVNDFVSDHKRAILIGTAAAAAATAIGVAYYASTSRRPGEGDAEKGERKGRDRKKSSKSSKKRKTVKDPDGPLLEERSPKVEEETGM
jgi:import receptor subunit TOM70